MIPFGLFMSPFVVAQRMPHLMWEAVGGNPFGQRESTVMLSEKLEAVQSGMVAAQREAVLATMETGLAMLRGQPAEAARLMLGSASRVTQAALQPAARKVSANLKRLRKK